MCSSVPVLLLAGGIVRDSSGSVLKPKDGALRLTYPRGLHPTMIAEAYCD
jgi:hypothetical protein